jgi:hypothetical protein
MSSTQNKAPGNSGKSKGPSQSDKSPSQSKGPSSNSGPSGNRGPNQINNNNGYGKNQNNSNKGPNQNNDNGYGKNQNNSNKGPNQNNDNGYGKNQNNSNKGPNQNNNGKSPATSTGKGPTSISASTGKPTSVYDERKQSTTTKVQEDANTYLERAKEQQKEARAGARDLVVNSLDVLASGNGVPLADKVK